MQDKVYWLVNKVVIEGIVEEPDPNIVLPYDIKYIYVGSVEDLIKPPPEAASSASPANPTPYASIPHHDDPSVSYDVQCPCHEEP